MKLKDEQTESAHVRRPATKMSNQVLFQFIGRDLIPEVSKRTT